MSTADRASLAVLLATLLAASALAAGASQDPLASADPTKTLPKDPASELDLPKDPVKEYVVGFEGAFPAYFAHALGGKVKGVDHRLGFAVVETKLDSAFATLAAGHPDITFVAANGLVRSTSARWDAATWDAATWDAATWDAGRWDAATWDASRWDASRWDASRWDAATWDASRWDASRWDASRWDASRWDQEGMDPGFPMQWNLGAMHADTAWETTMAYHARTICVVDSGVDASHPDLAANVLRAADGSYGWDFVNGDNDPFDDGGHGTHVAGIAAAQTGNGQGIAGVSQAWILAAKVLDSTGVGTDANLASGIAWCADAGAHIILLALHADNPSKVVKNAVDYAHARGALIVAASGNLGLSEVAFPANYGKVLAVGATDVDGNVADFSNRGSDLDLVAPGVRIPGLYPGARYAIGTGTSQAAANAAGAAALVWAAHPGLNAQGVAERLKATARDDGPAGFDAAYGSGHLRLDRAV